LAELNILCLSFLATGAGAQFDERKLNAGYFLLYQGELLYNEPDQ
jgi:hypothetical protein